MDNKKILKYLIIIGIIFAIIISVIFYIGYKKGTIKEEVKCYDSFKNEIIGLKCINERINIYTFVSMLSLHIIIFIYFIMILIYIIGRL